MYDFKLEYTFFGRPPGRHRPAAESAVDHPGGHHAPGPGIWAGHGLPGPARRSVAKESLYVAELVEKVGPGSSRPSGCGRSSGRPAPTAASLAKVVIDRA